MKKFNTDEFIEELDEFWDDLQNGKFEILKNYNQQKESLNKTLEHSVEKIPDKRFILFLDFDGVICTLRHSYAVGDRGSLGCLDPVALDFLNRICRENKIWVIISSTWRIGKNIAFFESLFKGTGHFDLVKSLYYPDYSIPRFSGIRGLEIEDWLQRNKEIVSDYLIIDDDCDFLEHQKPKHIQVDPINGLLFQNYRDIIKTLEKNEEIQNEFE